MLSATSDLATFLNSTTQGVTRGLVTITMRDGTVHRWARHKSAITFGGTTWQPHGQGGRPLISWSPVRSALGLEIVSVDVVLQCGEEATIGGKKLTLVGAQNGFRGARLKLERAYAASDSTSIVGVLPRFEGTIQSSPSTTTTVKLVVESDLALLQRPFPATLLTPACGNALGDAACGVDLSTWRKTTTVVGTPTRGIVYAATGQGLPSSALYELGRLVMNDGSLAGQSRTVRTHTYSAPYIRLEVSPPFPVAPAAGDSFTVTPGCDLTGSMCSGRYNNLGRFRGAPNLPREEG